MTVRNYFQLAGPAVTLIGIWLSLVGTYNAVTWFQLMDLRDFLASCFKGVFLKLTGRSDRAFEVAIELGKEQPENRGRAVLGVYFVFFGFLLQALGAVFWGVDMAWGILHPGP